jgi:hypothetical protein
MVKGKKKLYAEDCRPDGYSKTAKLRFCRAHGYTKKRLS